MSQTTLENFKIDKSNWETVKLGDVVFEPKETVKDPVAEGIKYVVGLEHIDSEDIHLRRFASIEESTTFTKKFRKGDVLFGRRRAYLKKAAQADFDGICSGDITVMRAKNNFLPELLPFVINNEKFFDYAVTHSAGGLSPRVKFKDLLNYEFKLPKAEEQNELLQLLQSANNLIEVNKKNYDQLDYIFKLKIKNICELNNKPNIERKKIKDVCYIKDNLRKPINSSSREAIKGDVPYYGANGPVGYVNDYIFNEDLVLLAEDGGNFFEFDSKEIAYKISGKSWVNNHAHVLSIKNDSCPLDWLYFSLIHKDITRIIVGGTRAKLNKGDLENIEIWIPDNQALEKILNEINTFFISREMQLQTTLVLINMNKLLITEIF